MAQGGPSAILPLVQTSFPYNTLLILFLSSQASGALIPKANHYFQGEWERGEEKADSKGLCYLLYGKQSITLKIELLPVKKKKKERERN